MYLFEEEKRFSPKTGEPVDSIWTPSGFCICDYCGELMEDDVIADTRMTITPLGNVEAWFHEDRDFLGSEERQIDLYDFFEKQKDFHFCTYYGPENCESRLLLEWAYYSGNNELDSETVSLINTLGPLYHGSRPDNEICGIFSRSRYRVLRHVLKTLDPQSLGIEFDE